MLMAATVHPPAAVDYALAGPCVKVRTPWRQFKELWGRAWAEAGGTESWTLPAVWSRVLGAGYAGQRHRSKAGGFRSMVPANTRELLRLAAPQEVLVWGA